MSSGQSPTVTVRCPVCDSPKDAALPRRQIDGTDDDADPGPLQGTGVRCAACGESFECYYF